MEQISSDASPDQISPIGMHAERLTPQEQTLLFKRWENQQRQDLAEQSEPTVKDIAEAYEMPLAEVYRQLQEVRAQQCQADLRARARRQNVLWAALVSIALLATAFSVFFVLRLIHSMGQPSVSISAPISAPIMAPPEIAVSSAARHDDQGNQLFADKQYAEAETEFLQAVQTEPNIPMYHNDLGADLAKEKKYAEALPQYRQAARLMPDRAIYRENLAAMYLELSKYRAAAAAYQAAIALDPGNSQNYIGLGDSLRKQDKNRQAEMAFRQALYLLPGNDYVLDCLGIVVGNQHRIAESAGYFRQALAESPANRVYQGHLKVAEQMLREGKR